MEVEGERKRGRERKRKREVGWVGIWSEPEKEKYDQNL